jgi:hypothetical protein
VPALAAAGVDEIIVDTDWTGMVTRTWSSNAWSTLPRR